MNKIFIISLLFSFNLFAQQNNYKRIDISKLLFGIEYTFQDQKIVNEPGRLTFSTPHKKAKFNLLKRHYFENLGLNDNSITLDTTHSGFKPGINFYVPDQGNYVMNMEPVTIEVNTTPKTVNEIVEAATPLFNAAKKSELFPYVNPAAERSGMGHIHTGAKTLSESPFYLYPNLLRNILVYYHKHPSLLFGFAEAFDIGHVVISKLIIQYLDKLLLKMPLKILTSGI